MSEQAPPGDGDDAAELARLRRDAAARDDLFALVSHELRNPLHALSLQLALARTLAAGGSAAAAAERMGRAESSLRRYAGRVTVLTELLGAPGGAYPLSPGPVDVRSLLGQVVEGLEEEARTRGIALALEVEGPEADWLGRIDAIAFEQVVDNLVLNAFKHSSARHVALRLRALPGAWIVEIRDDGTGIAHEDQREIFRKSAVASRSPRGAGRGLGLWIVERIVHAMHGEIELASAPGAGCAFTLRLPHAPRGETPE